MALSKFEKDMQIIQALDDEPNDVGGLTAAELKAKYDEGGEAVKAFLNDVLLPALDAYIARTDNPHAVTKEQVGLGAADDTADADKPVSGPQAAALALKAYIADVLTKDNTTEFTPTENYHPATKKYVDGVTAGVILGQVPDNSITTAKLAEEVHDFINSKAAAVHASSHATGGSDPLTPAQIGAATSQLLYCTVPVSWTAVTGGFYTQTVSVPGILESDEGIKVDINPGSDNDANKLYAGALSKVQTMETLADAIKFVCTAAPTVAFPLKLEVTR
ncbi:hypothetical protein OBV_01660 [Oscillibacter valericigenes Sjm18-20]|nr:hypothetical protein OBV_01660 [Oscillibacter valericigenes Sjm18-20]